MIDKIILLSGHVSSGKTTLCDMLKENYGAIVFKTRTYLKELKNDIKSERSAMQNLGDVLDKRTKGSWVCDGLAETINENDSNNNKYFFIVDAVRIKKQIDHIRKAYGNKVVHVHLHPPTEELITRYKRRKSKGFKELKSFKEVLNNKTEKQVDDLKDIADIVIDTKRCTPNDVLVKAACHLSLYGREYSRHVDVLIGGQYGSEGKGNISAYLAPEYDILMRVGGPNAGHKVYKEPEHLNFHHLPSGCKNSPESKILIGPGATIYIKTLFEEINKFDISPDRLFIDKQTMVITEEDQEYEIKLVESIGSTGQGVGAANARRIIDRIPGKKMLAQDYKELNPYTCYTIEKLQRAFIEGKKYSWRVHKVLD
jgi:adenylosuccinate synthase